jgi:cell division protein FtsB
MRKRITALVIIIVLVLILFNLARQISDALGASDRLDQAADRLSNLQEQNRRLKDRLEVVNHYDFVQETARNKLNMAKNNETVVIIPQKDIDTVLGSQKKVEPVNIPNWQGWLNLIFH